MFWPFQCRYREPRIIELIINQTCTKSPDPCDSSVQTAAYDFISSITCCSGPGVRFWMTDRGSGWRNESLLLGNVPQLRCQRHLLINVLRVECSCSDVLTAKKVPSIVLR